MYTHTSSSLHQPLGQRLHHAGFQAALMVLASLAIWVFWLLPRYTEWQLMDELETISQELAAAKMNIEVARSQGKFVLLNRMPVDMENPHDFFALELTHGSNPQEENNPDLIRSPYLSHIQLLTPHAKINTTRPFNTLVPLKQLEIVATLGKSSLLTGAVISFKKAPGSGAWQCVIYQNQAKRRLLPSHMPNNCRLAMHTSPITP